MMKDDESLEEQERKVDDNIDLLKKMLIDQQWRDRIANNPCVVCKEKGCDVISFEHQKPAHNRCINPQSH